MALLAPAFLAGLLAIGLPLWLHRLSSTNPNRQVFSSLMFLEPGEPRRVLAKKLQYLLLLALRVGFLVLLALVFAQPTWFRSPFAAAGDDAELHVLVLDASASMSHDDRWPRALQAAEDVLADMGSGDRAQVIAAGRVAEIVTQPTDDPAIAGQAVRSIEPTAFRVDYGQLTRALDGVLRAADLPVVLHLVTDAQQSAMPARFAELAPARPARLAVHDVSGPDDANWAVESFGGSALTGELEAQLRSFAAEPAERTVRLELNGQVVEERVVTIEPYGRSDVGFDPLELAAGANRVTVSLAPGDDLTADDRRFLSLKRPQPRDVLLVSGGGRRGSDDLFVRSALETLDALALEAKGIGVSALADEPLAEYSFIVVTDAGLLGAAEAEQLAGYVEAGGALLLALAQRSSSLNTLPVTGHTLDRIGTGSLSPSQTVSVSSVDASHPALRGLDGLRSGKFTRYIALTTDEQDDVLLELDTGAPLLIEREIGAGRALVFTSTLDREWSDLPVQPVFVPFIAGLANYLLGGAGFSTEAALGSTLSVRLMGLQGGQIFDPEGDPALALGGGSDDVVLDQTGFYEVVGGGRTEIVAVNLDARESDLATAGAGTIERWQALGFDGEEPGSAPGASGEAAETVPVPLGPWLLWVLIAAVLMESLVGNWHLRVRRGIAT